MVRPAWRSARIGVPQTRQGSPARPYTAHTTWKLPQRDHRENLTPEVVRGKHLWETRNCIGCHTILGEGAGGREQTQGEGGSQWQAGRLRDVGGHRCGLWKVVNENYC